MNESAIVGLRAAADRHLKARQFGLAIRVLHGALAAAPADVASYILWARALRGLQRLDAAAAVLTRALAIAPGDWQLHFDMGETLQALPYYEGAEHVLQRAIQLEPARERSPIQLAKLLVLMFRYVQAAELLADLIARHPDHDFAPHLLGHCQFNLRNYHESFPNFLRSIALNPRSAIALFRIGRTCLRLGRIDDCAAWTACAVALDPALARRREVLLATLTPDKLTSYMKS